MLLILGPVLDMQVSGKWVWHYEPSVPSMQCLALSCAVAAMVSVRHPLDTSAMPCPLTVCRYKCVQASHILGSRANLSPLVVQVNVSQFMCLGRFQAVTFQVLGHTKTVLVLFMGWLLLGDIITGRKLVGMLLAVAGMGAYGWFNSRLAQAAAHSN